ncbi:lasso peptide biosynthesis PqqD family chaperone [Metabacillus sediminilitoris]|uniref:Lasso peptide biosynthesis PqqD family chaperone n=1 Tax=Metabacillus sediminilitoris TaxID=2567941 RepID=A0A4S4C0S7_9BACI|nr:lasso peptide biosynthesis PqqD family chaperone [Metabacillus sediminilitoris]QGQ47210.1 lasso peptide biosynthesis PqqD family chaperone [Metabacillus sediminilitoris]THF80554.1 lasso peptide biosynthesis PqqD family chaperone [Metabacillus sediminilitoris]
MIKIQSLSISNFICQVEGNIVSDMDDEKVILSIQNGKYYNLGDLGGKIWELIKSPISIEQLVKGLMAHYEVEESECSEQVLNFLKSLYDEGLIQVEKTS